MSISTRPQRNTSDEQESGLPISQSSELPISQSCGFPISQFKDGLLGNLRMDYQASSELPNREFHYIDLEITSETTGIDYSSPQSPQGELSEGTTQQTKSEFDQKTAKPSPLNLQPQQTELLRLEAEPTNNSPLASHQERYPSSSEQAASYSWGKFSAVPTADLGTPCTDRNARSTEALRYSSFVALQIINNFFRVYELVSLKNKKLLLLIIAAFTCFFFLR